MHERKALMNDLSDAFIALPGGFGTLDEFFEVLTWSQLGFHGKPCALLNVAGFYDAMLAMLDHAVTERFLRPHTANSSLRILIRYGCYNVLAPLSPAPKEKWVSAKGNFL